MPTLRLPATLALGWMILVSPAAEADFTSRYDPATRQAVLTHNQVLPTYDVQDQDGWVTLVFPAGQPGVALHRETGKPELPCLEYWISVPPQARVMSASLKSQKQTRPLRKPLKPGRRPYIPAEGVQPPGLAPDPGVYQSPEVFPREDIQWELATMGSTHVLVLRVFPWKYRGRDKALITCRDFQLEIVLESPDWRPNPVPENRLDAEVKRKLLNPEEAFFGMAGRP